jgi:PilZ domain
VAQGNWQRSVDALENHLQATEASFLTGQNEANERRSRNRFAHRLPARVWGIDIEREAFGLDCAIENISAAGVYLTIPRRVKSASDVSLIVHLLEGPHGTATAAIRGKVLRIAPLSDERYGVAIEITECRFL